MRLENILLIVLVYVTSNLVFVKPMKNLIFLKKEKKERNLGISIDNNDKYVVFFARVKRKRKEEDRGLMEN